MRILITNDDGIEAPGLDVLEKIATDLTDDWAVRSNLISVTPLCLDYTDQKTRTKLAKVLDDKRQ
jgi:broad specificity polyphosphatase/5'/3'-nucleotidase SurE